ncbi:MAG: hypothetical protein WKF96_00115 [Solirubrobacteraceae bacterium]
MQSVAYALRADHEAFTGGVLAVGDGDIDIGAELEAGNGTIVVHASDQVLIDLLDLYAPLKRAEVPDGATALSRHERRTVTDLRHLASLRDLTGAGSLSRADLVRVLDAHDASLAHGAQAGGDYSLGARVAAGDQAAIREALGEPALAKPKTGGKS